MLGIAPGARLNDNADLDRDLDLIAGSGAHAFRWYPSQAGVERVMGSGDYDWTEPDAVLGGGAKRDLSMLVGVSPRFDGHAYDADRVDASAAYARALVERYAGLAGFLGLEGHNEAFFTKVDAQPTAARYTVCQSEIYRSVKSVAPNVLVGTGGIIGSSRHLVDLYAAGCNPFFDFVAWHPYVDPRSVQQAIHDGHGGWPAMIDARHVMVANGDAHKQMWVTEIGWNTAGAEPVSEQQQADYIADAVGRFRRHAWAGPMFVFCGWDAPTGTDKGDSMGLYRADGSEKIAVATFRELAKVA